MNKHLLVFESYHVTAALEIASSNPPWRTCLGCLLSIGNGWLVGSAWYSKTIRGPVPAAEPTPGVPGGSQK